MSQPATIPLRSSDELLSTPDPRSPPRAEPDFIAQSHTIALKAPIEYRGERITHVTLKPLTGGDYRKIGALPFRDRGDGHSEFDPDRMARAMVLLSGLQLEAIDALRFDDWIAVATKAALFFDISAAIS